MPPKARSGYTKKRKYRGNQYSTESKRSKKEKTSVSTKGLGKECSASARKIPAGLTTASSEGIKECKESIISGFRFVDMRILSSVMECMPCKECFVCDLILQEQAMKRKGCASNLRLLCCSCGWSMEFFTSAQIGRFFEVNRRFVYASRSVGCGRAAGKRFCGLMNMPPPPRPTPYARHNKEILRAVKKISLETMRDTAREIHDIKPGSDEGIARYGVSVDGTWQRRGFSSLNGCVSAISMDTGKVVDVEPLSKVCIKCREHENDPDTPETTAWRADHRASCKANFKGSAPAMEPEGALRMFQRSVDLHKLQYDEYYGDGDSKSYSLVKDVYQVYDIEVQKKECVGHVQKRLGTALRKLKKEKKGMGGKGRLTDAMIDRLQNYYGIAIRSNSGDLAAMKKAIYASLFHCASSADSNYHGHCPEGPESWCGFQRDKVNRTNTFKHGTGLPLDVREEIKPIYKRLSEDSLLSKCLDGKTQNQNESLNGMVWERVPKGVFVGSEVLQLGVYDAVAHFNIGSRAAIKVFESLGIPPGEFCINECQQLDKIRVLKAEYKFQEKNKTRRRLLRGKRKKKNDKSQEKEGDIYAPGAF